MSTWVCVWVCVWSWAMSRARDTLMTWNPVVCFTISNALIRWEPLCSTARLINEEQPCAAGDTCAHSFKHITLGSNRLCGRTQGYVHAHKNIHTLNILLTVCRPSIKSLLAVTTSWHTLIHIRTHTHSLKNHHVEYKVRLAWLGDMHPLALTSVVSESANCNPRVFLCGKAPPDYSCYIINIDQICFVA